MEFPKEFEQRMRLLLEDDYDAFIEGYRHPIRRGLRINTQKITEPRFLELFPHTLSPSPFAENSFYLDELHKAGSDPLHHAGAYYMQEPSAASAVTVLNPQLGERILDLCAAPGGKSTQIAALLGNTGLIWSNEYVSQRARILQQNMERWGARNSIISNQDSGILCNSLAGFFDAVLVDAPCSGEGMFRKEPQALIEWSIDNIQLCASRQAEILSNAAIAVRPGGRIVYSTCTFAPEENEAVVADFLQKHPEFTLVPITVSWGCPGFSSEQIRPLCPSLPDCYEFTHCRRIFPQHGGEGHFIALLQKQGDSPAMQLNTSNRKTDLNAAAARQLYEDCFIDTPDGYFETVGDYIRLFPCDLPNCQGLGVLSAGISVAAICKNRFEPTHSLFIASHMENCQRSLDFPLDHPSLLAFLHGEEIPCDGTNGWTAVCVCGIPVGFGKVSGGKLKNRYPKGLRLI